MVRFRPLSSKLSNILSIVIDFNISLSYSLAGLFLIKQEGFNKNYIEWIIIGIVAFSFAFVLSINIYNIIIAVLHLLKNLGKSPKPIGMTNQKSNNLSNSREISTTNYVENQCPSSPALFSEVDLDFAIRIDECDCSSISES